MEYEFIHDPITGELKAQLSYEQATFGPWLESELANNSDKLQEILALLDDALNGKFQDKLIVGQEYSLIVTEDDVAVKANTLFTQQEELPEHLQSDELALDTQAEASCGIEDFIALLNAWGLFVKK